MNLTFLSNAHIQTANGDGLQTYDFAEGDRSEVPDDVAVLFLNQGVAVPSGGEKLTVPDGEVAVVAEKPRRGRPWKPKPEIAGV